MAPNAEKHVLYVTNASWPVDTLPLLMFEKKKKKKKAITSSELFQWCSFENPHLSLVGKGVQLPGDFLHLVEMSP